MPFPRLQGQVDFQTLQSQSAKTPILSKPCHCWQLAEASCACAEVSNLHANRALGFHAFATFHDCPMGFLPAYQDCPMHIPPFFPAKALGFRRRIPRAWSAFWKKLDGFSGEWSKTTSKASAISTQANLKDTAAPANKSPVPVALLWTICSSSTLRFLGLRARLWSSDNFSFPNASQLRSAEVGGGGARVDVAVMVKHRVIPTWVALVCCMD